MAPPPLRGPPLVDSANSSARVHCGWLRWLGLLVPGNPVQPLGCEFVAMKPLEVAHEVRQHANNRLSCLRRLALLCFTAAKLR
jgi:hypothetical protein